VQKSEKDTQWPPLNTTDLKSEKYTPDVRPLRSNALADALRKAGVK
jgi:hypothetical protein